MKKHKYLNITGGKKHCKKLLIFQNYLMKLESLY